MIAYIRGTLAEKDISKVVIEAAGVGYEMLIPVSTFDRLPREGEEVKLLAWHNVREDGETLFGFATARERDMFVKLTGVGGVGPKIALAILSGSSIGELSMAIASGDAKRISAIKGVGRKTAEKICVELRDKVDLFESGALSSEQTENSVIRDAVAALRALGFNEETSSKMVAEVLASDPSLDNVEAVIKATLKSR